MSEHFTEADLIHSDRAVALGIDNTPTIDIREQLEFTMAGLERVRAHLGFDLKINSGYRCPALNKAVGGSEKSQHMKGEAVDFTCPQFTVLETCNFLSRWRFSLGIDQLIFENTWVHVSFTLSPRHEVLTYRNGKYLQGVVA